MKTFSFIGTHKNAGKTTAFNFMAKYVNSSNQYNLCLTSIGLSGEHFDSFTGKIKPEIIIPKNAYFITSSEHLRGQYGDFEIISDFHPPLFFKNYLFVKALKDIPIILEGPNQKKEILLIKKYIKGFFNEKFSSQQKNQTLLLIDGAIDRIFLGDPSICDGFFFSILLKSSEEESEKVKRLLLPLTFEVLPQNYLTFFQTECQDEEGKATLVEYCEDQLKILYKTKTLPFYDKLLIDKIRRPLTQSIAKKILFLNTILEYDFLKELSLRTDLDIVLKSFTLYQHPKNASFIFRPKIYLFHPLHLKAIFIKEETTSKRLPIELASNIQIFNLYREIPYEIIL